MKRTNVVLVLLDDYGWKDSTCYGSEFYETPNLDKLAADGMRFTNAYASCPVCSPTRASMLTGKYPARLGVTNWINHGNGHPNTGKLIDVPYVKQLETSEYNLAKCLGDNGYQTWHVGKWHLGLEDYWPLKQGFDKNVGGCHMGCPYHGYFSPWQIPTLEEGPEGEYLTDRITNEAVKLIENRDTDKPFFLNMWYYTVHTPIQAKQEYITYFEQKAKDMGIDTIEPFVEGEYFACDHKKDQRVRRRVIQSDPVYAAMIKSMDENLGKLMQAITDAGEEDNTLFIFTSDNGGLATAEGSPTCNAPLAEGKGWMYEGGTREPLVIKLPGTIEAGSVSHCVTTTPDIYPTVLEACGLDAQPQQHCDGKSILPVLKGDESYDRGPVFWHYPHYGNQGGTPGSSVREGDYKLIEFFEDNRIELYNLKDDISEEKNLAEQLPDIAKDLHVKLAQWRQDVLARVPQRNPSYEPFDRFAVVNQ
ncbi:MAG: sulfatase [Phycisphaeraceae bacterium]|nr:sulfatase [Phycisphaeraceae bacterium]